MDAASRNWIAIVTAESIVIRVRQVQTAQMPVTIYSEVPNFDRVRPHVAYQSGSHQESIAIKFAAGPIVVVKRAGLNRVALLNKVLPKNIRDVDVLMAAIEPVKAAVGVFLKLRKISEV